MYLLQAQSGFYASDFSTVEQIGGAKTVTLGEKHLPQGVATDFWLTLSESGAMYSHGRECWAVGGATHTHRACNQGHNNLQPYITCYMWKRIA